MASSSSTLHNPLQAGKKRKLADDGVGAGAPAELIRDEHVWFADGNLIVRAGPGCSGDGPVYGFRVHSAVLAARSPVFADMFAAPHTAGETLDGAACVDLPDAHEDVRGLLRYLYGCVDMQPLVVPRHADTLDAIGGPLRLAAKYDMESVTRALVPVLERDWPRTYDAWVHAEQGARLHRADVPRAQQREQDPAMAVRLAMDLRLGAVLPAAFYELGGLPISKPLTLYEPSRWADGTLLASEDVLRLTVGRERIARYLKDVLYRDVSDEVYELRDNVYHTREREADGCVASLERWWDRLHPTAAEMYSGGPLAALHALSKELESEEPDDDEPLAGVCRGCRCSLAGDLQAEARNFWGKLPEIFDLGSLPFE